MMMFDLIAKFFPKEQAQKSAGFPAPAVLKSIGATVLTVLGTVQCFLVPKDTLARFGGKEGPEQRARSLKYARFLTRRPDFSQKLGIPADAYQGIIDRNEALDGLLMIIMLGREAVEHLVLLVAASVSQRCRTVIDYVMSHLVLDGTATQDQGRAQNAFMALVYNVQAGDRMRARAHQDKARTKADQQTQLTGAHDQASQLALVHWLIDQVLAGAESQLPPPAPPAKGKGAGPARPKGKSKPKATLAGPGTTPSLPPPPPATPAPAEGTAGSAPKKRSRKRG